MLYALSENKEKVTAYPVAKGYCQVCEQELVPKCGNINIWHWAHKVNTHQCEHESETAWHLRWKSLFPKEMCEVVFKKDGVRKIADGVLSNGTVVEIQHSPISSDEISFRENFYGKMFWVFDAIKAYREERLLLRDRGEIFTFRWKHPKKSLCYVSKPCYLDLGDYRLFRLKKIHPVCPVGGWGYIDTLDTFILFVVQQTNQTGGNNKRLFKAIDEFKKLYT